MFRHHIPFVNRRAVAALAAAIVVAASPGRVNAQQGAPPAPPAPPVDELVAQALANAPSIAARRARLAAAKATLPRADASLDPTIEFEWRDGGFPRWTLGSDPMSMIGGSIRQPLLSKGRKAARLASATAEVDVRHAETDAAACDLISAVRTEYSRLYAIDQERSILRDAEEMGRLLAETAISRYASGASDQTAVLRAQLERTRLSERVADLDADRSVVVTALNRLLNRPPEAPVGEVRSLPELPPFAEPVAALPVQAAGNAAEVAVRQADMAAASKRVEVARAELGSNWSVGGSFFWQGNADRIVAFTVGVELPFHKDRKQKPLLAASERELEAARFELEDMSAAMRAEAARLAAEAARANEQIERYRSGLLPQSSAALDAARASYLGGRGDFASVLDEFRRWSDVRVELARREASRFAALGQLDVLVHPIEHGDWDHEPAKPASRKEPRS